MTKSEKVALSLEPAVIEAALEHCINSEVCDECPALELSRQCYCGHVLNIAVLNYIRLLKEQNKTLAQRVLELEGGASNVK